MQQTPKKLVTNIGLKVRPRPTTTSTTTTSSSCAGKNCFICGLNVQVLGSNWRTIFESGRLSRKPQNFDIRIATVLQVPKLTREVVGKNNCVCRHCIQKLEKIEKGQKVFQELRDIFTRDRNVTECTSSARFKRLSTESPSTSERLVKQVPTCSSPTKSSTKQLNVDKDQEGSTPDVNQENLDPNARYDYRNPEAEGDEEEQVKGPGVQVRSRPTCTCTVSLKGLTDDLNGVSSRPNFILKNYQNLIILRSFSSL